MNQDAPAILERIRKYFQRQEDFVAQMEALLPRQLADVEDLDVLLGAQEKSLRTMAEFQREQALLRMEWEASEVSSGDREAIQAEGLRLSGRIAALGEHLDRLTEEAAQLQVADEAALQQARRGRNVLDAYRPGEAGPRDGTGWNA